MRELVTAILGAALFFGAQAPTVAQAGPPAAASGALTAVSFTPRKDSLEFVFRAQQAVTADQLSVYGDDEDAEVLNIKLAGVAATRRWVTMPDAQIDRALLHVGKDGAVLRIRMQSKGSVSAAILDAVKVHEAEGAVVVRVPRTAAVAAEWAAAEQPASAVPGVAAAAAPASVAAAPASVAAAPASVAAAPASVAAAPALATPVAIGPASQAPASVAAAPASVAAAPAAPLAESDTDKSPTLADTPLTLSDESIVSADDPGSVVANAGVSESTGMGAAAATIFLLFGGGIFLWRKIRGHHSERGTGRLIRPLGTHVLGPKQGLLLLDVAGEMVLIGTSDKGVQMLTKIEKSDRSAEPASAPRVATAPQADLDLLKNEAVARAPKMNVAERATAAIAKVRALAEARKAHRLETADEDVTADAIERSFFDRADAHLAEAAAGVEDDYEPRAENFFARLKRAAERLPEPQEAAEAPVPTPALVPSPASRVSAPTPAPRRAAAAVAAAPRNGGDEAALTNDILRKIRQLQGA